MDEHSTVVVTIRGQRFAKFGKYLADLTPFEYTTPRGDRIHCEPIADDAGRYTAVFPEEGRSSLQCRFTNHTRQSTHVGNGPFRWIHASEQHATNQEIADRTSEMLDDGQITPY